MAASRDPQTILDIEQLIDGCTGVGNLLDEVTLLRVALRAYLDGRTPADAVAWASHLLSESLTRQTTPP